MGVVGVLKMNMMELLSGLKFKSGVDAYRWMDIHYCRNIQLRNGFSLAADFYGEKKKRSCHLVVVKRGKNPLLPEKVIDVVLNGQTHSKLTDKIIGILSAKDCLETGKKKIVKFQDLINQINNGK